MAAGGGHRDVAAGLAAGLDALLALGLQNPELLLVLRNLAGEQSARPLALGAASLHHPGEVLDALRLRRVLARHGGCSN